MRITCNCRNGNSNHCVTVNCPHQSTLGCSTLLLISAFVQQMTGLCPSNRCLWHKDRERKRSAHTATASICALIIHFPFSICVGATSRWLFGLVDRFVHFLCSATQRTINLVHWINCTKKKKMSFSSCSKWNFIVTATDAWLTLFCVLFNPAIGRCVFSHRWHKVIFDVLMFVCLFPLPLLWCSVPFMFIVPNQINDRWNEEESNEQKNNLSSYMWLNGRKLSISTECDVQASGASVLMSLPCRHSTLPHYSHHCFTTQRTHSAYMPAHGFHTCRLTRPQRLTGINYCWPHAHFVLFFSLTLASFLYLTSSST